MVNGTLLNFGKRYEDDLRVIFDQWPKLHLGLDALSNQKIKKVSSTAIVQAIYMFCWPLHRIEYVNYEMRHRPEAERHVMPRDKGQCHKWKYVV